MYAIVTENDFVCKKCVFYTQVVNFLNFDSVLIKKYDFLVSFFAKTFVI